MNYFLELNSILQSFALIFIDKSLTLAHDKVNFIQNFYKKNSQMKKYLTTAFSFFFLVIFLVPTIILAQPGRVEGDFGIGWSNYTLIDKGAVKAVKIQASATNATNQFLFNNSGGNYNPKWCGSNAPDVTRILNSRLNGAAFYYTGGLWDQNLEFSMTDGNYYTFIVGSNATSNNDMSILETVYNPNTITTVIQTPEIPYNTDEVVVTATLSGTLNANEYAFIRYTTDNWATSTIVSMSFNSGTDYLGVIPVQVAGTEVDYYVLTSNDNAFSTDDADYFSLELDNNSGSNYSFSVSAPLSCDDASGVLTSEPIFPIHDGAITITFDATRGNGALMNYEGDVYAHTGLITSESEGNNDWQYVNSEWGVNDAEYLFTEVGDNLYEFTIDNIRDFYGVAAGEEIYKITMVIRAGEPIIPEEPDNFLVARNADGSDFHLEVYTEGTNVKIVGNLTKDPLVPVNTVIPVCVYAMDATTITLKIDDMQVDQISDLHLMYALNTGDYSAGIHEIVAIADDGTNFAYDTTWFYIRGDVVIEDLPAGMKNGINYINGTTVTLVLFDPSIDKDFAFVIGDFNNWTTSDDGYMKRTPDGTHYWTTITGLTPGTEYAYQFYIDGEKKLADPYCDKILDPWNDRWIPETTYPNLKIYPWDLTMGIVSVFQTEETDYTWVIDDFTPVAVNETQSNLIIYELLIRDFVESKDIKDVIDTLDYLQNLGVNAIELMPIQEFDGNDSWGYAPNFYYAPDKAYGTKDDYKLFIDECHQRGIAVIMDVVFNHMYGGSPFVQMYWDEENNQVASNSAWFNQEATHPYSIGYDFNHESTNTRELVKDVLSYWMTEYKIDGFRFDLSKGFTQFNSGGDVGVWSAYDQSRIDIIMDYYNHVKGIDSESYFILEHFADNGEEVVLANAGCMLWGVMTTQFAQTTMGYDNNHDFSWADYSERGFTYPNLIPFMESHDEERMMYETVTYGNGFANDTTVSLQRMEAIATMYMTIPGPKMLWQFGETGYDESIFLCSDGSYSDDCRTSSKPIHWEYMNDLRRQKVYWTYAGMAKLKTENQAFLSGDFGQDQGGLGKRMWVSDATMNISVTANFATTGFDMSPSFQHTGTWYNYFTGESIDVSDAGGYTLYYNPGDYYVFTDVQLDKPYANLQFNVKNTSGVNIQNADVTIQGYSSLTTDVSGNADFLYGTNTTVNYTVSATGYTSKTGTVSMGVTDDVEYVILESTIDVAEIEHSDIIVYPNPTDNYLTIQTNELFKVSIYDIIGKQVKSVKMTANHQSIDLSRLLPGIYTLVFENNSKTEVKKVVVK